MNTPTPRTVVYLNADGPIEELRAELITLINATQKNRRLRREMLHRARTDEAYCRFMARKVSAAAAEHGTPFTPWSH